MKKSFFTVLLMCVIQSITVAQNSNFSAVVPAPSFFSQTEDLYLLKDGYRVKTQRDLSDAAKLLIEDVNTIFGIDGKLSSSQPEIELKINKSLKDEEYRVRVTSKNVEIEGGNYNAVVMGITTLLQLVDPATQTIKGGEIFDAPKMGYRSYMLDVARQWVEIPTIKQIIDLCRWYKLNYMQLHLTDDQLFTFGSTIYPKLPTPDRHYTKRQLAEIVEYARVRGVVIIPEFDLPGHSSTMRRNMPELFGEQSWGVIDLANPKTIEAVKKLTKEIIDIFTTSKYFHIGADEAWLGEYAKLDHVKKYVADMGFDEVHDLYMDFIVNMHNFVKECGKETLVWESFQGNGSNRVKIPTDMTVIAWETMYQSPQSLLKNGYPIINASWKPIYTTPGRRWSQEYIYEWNVGKWENHWNVTPSYQEPIELPISDSILGAQMCAWEMIDHEQLQTAEKRIAAFAQNVWSPCCKPTYEEFYASYTLANDKVQKLIFPAIIEQNNFKAPCEFGLYDNKINHFANVGEVRITPLNPQNSIHYTVDGEIPTKKSPKLPPVFIPEHNTVVKYAVFNKSGKILGYHTAKYVHEPIDAIQMFDRLDVLNRNIHRTVENFQSVAEVALVNRNSDGEIFYTVDGATPTINSLRYEGLIRFENSATLRAQCFDKQGNLIGAEYRCDYNKVDTQLNATTNRPIESLKPGKAIQKAVDGIVDINNYWGSESPNSVIVDLGQVKSLSATRLYTFWDNNRYYGFDIEFSEDKNDWVKVVDRSDNREVATPNGYVDILSTPQNARYVKVNMLSNSSNPAMHIVELRVY